MKEITGNLWDQEADALCITTNGYVKHNGEAVMGRGCAKEAAERFPGLSLYLGQAIKRGGNQVRGVAPRMLWKFAGYEVGDEAEALDQLDWWLVFFPVKHFWRDKADIELIKRSANELVELTDRMGWTRVVLPRPGCGNGRLAWDLVKPVIEPVFDDRFEIITFA